MASFLKSVFVISIISQALSGTAGAWEIHRSLMPWVAARLTPQEITKLNQLVSVPAPVVTESRYRDMARALQLNPNGKLISGSEKSGLQILTLAVDDPDQGMDQDLPAAFDPGNERKFMGGMSGPTSQGFRHAFFGGWQILHPITTFQVPLHAMGQAPERTRIFARFARELFEQGDFAWGVRIIGWAMHYVQDLSQPFHAVQIPNLRMVPFSHLFTDLVPETTRVISNYHWVYEGYTLEQIQSGQPSTLKTCLSETVKSELHWDQTNPRENPADLTLEVADASLELASEMGSALVAFTLAAGIDLKDPKIDLAHNIGSVDYRELATRPALAHERERLEKVTCLALRNGLDASARLVQWALQP